MRVYRYSLLFKSLLWLKYLYEWRHWGLLLSHTLPASSPEAAQISLSFSQIPSPGEEEELASTLLQTDKLGVGEQESFYVQTSTHAKKKRGFRKTKEEAVVCIFLHSVFTGSYTSCIFFFFSINVLNLENGRWIK